MKLGVICAVDDALSVLGDLVQDRVPADRQRRVRFVDAFRPVGEWTGLIKNVRLVEPVGVRRGNALRSFLALLLVLVFFGRS